MNIDTNTLHWLAGLLEGEGSFLAPLPSAPTIPHISITMTDEDIIERVSHLFRNHHYLLSQTNTSWKVAYKAVLGGSHAVELMRTVYPLMGQRRQLQIDRALNNYVDRSDAMRNVNNNKLNESQVREIKQRIALKHTSKEIAADYGITIFTIREIRQGKIWKHVTLDDPIPSPIPTIQLIEPDFESLDWLAGLLEGEGSFCPAPPSSPNRPYIALAMTDEDVVARACRILEVNYQLIRTKNEAHKDYYLAQLRGERAVDFMRTLCPKMGIRRQGQIMRVVQNYQPHDASHHRPGAKINADDVREIRRRIINGEAMKALAETYGVSYSIVVDIKLRRTWKNI